jgi:hypothetical protein
MLKIHQVAAILVGLTWISGCAHFTAQERNLSSNCPYFLSASITPSLLDKAGQPALCDSLGASQQITSRSFITLTVTTQKGKECREEIQSISFKFNGEPIKCGHFLSIHNNITDSWGRKSSNAGLQAALENCISEHGDWLSYAQNLVVSTTIIGVNGGTLWTGATPAKIDWKNLGDKCP